MRNRINGIQLLEDISSIADRLATGEEPVCNASLDPLDPNPPAVFTPLSPHRIQSLKAAADIKLKLLNKVLPDPKAIPEDAQDERVQLTHEERAARLVALLRRANPADTGRILEALGAPAPRVN